MVEPDGRRRCGRLPLLARRGDGARADADRGRRLLAARLMEPTEHNRRAWDEIHRQRAEGARRRARPSATGAATRSPTSATSACCIFNAGPARRPRSSRSSAASSPASTRRCSARGRARALAVDPLGAGRPGRRCRASSGVDASTSSIRLWGHSRRSATSSPGSAGSPATLRSGGDFLLFEEHPVALCVDGLMHWRESYFDAGSRRLGQIVTSVARTGFGLRALEEYPARSDSWRRHDARVPGTFLLYAQRARGAASLAARAARTPRRARRPSA